MRLQALKRSRPFLAAALIVSSLGCERAIVVDDPPEVSGLAFLRDGRELVSTTRGGKLELRKPSTADSYRTVEAENWIAALAVSPDKAFLATANWDGTLSLWDTTTWEVVASLKGHTAPVLCAVFSTDGKHLFSSGRDRHILVWNVETKAIENELKGHGHWVECLALSPDGSCLVSGDWDGVVKVWDVSKKREIATIKAHTDAVLSLAFSPNGHLLASGAQDQMPLKLWRTEDWTKKATLTSDMRSGRCVLFLSNDELITGSNDRTIRIWDIESGRCSTQWKAHDRGWVMRIAVSPDKSTLASGDFTGEVKVWSIAEVTREEPKTDQEDGIDQR